MTVAPAPIDLVESAPPVPVPPSPFAPLSVEELAALPPTTWQIAGVLPERGFCQLFAPSGAGKSLVTLDMMLTIAAGIPTWFGREVVPGRVVYVVGEGLHGLLRRIQAWQAIHPGADTRRFAVVPAMPSLRDPASVEQLLDGLRQGGIFEAEWVCWDTFARAIPGVDENSASEVGLAIAAAQRVGNELGAGTLLIHHAGHNTSRERGSTALRAACDTVLSLDEDDGRHTLKVVKQRDGDHGEPIHLRMVKQPPSVVFQDADPPAPVVTSGQRDMLEALQKSGLMTFTALVQSSPKSRSTASDLVRTLVGLGFAEKSGEVYRITEAGKEAIA